MKRYPHYKPSGVKWIGDVPEHWGTRKIKNLFAERCEKNHPDEEQLCATQSQGVIPQRLYNNRVVVVNKGFEGLKLVEIGDFVISLRSFQGGIEYAYYRGIISAAYTILSLKTPDLEKDYVKHLFKSHAFIQLLKSCVIGIREGQNINYDLLRKHVLPVPPTDEQRDIVEYIDRKIQEIDGYIVAKDSEIEKLGVLKQAVISRAVTRGLDPAAPMKDSQIPWVGDVPEHWGKLRIKNLFTLRDERNYEDLSKVNLISVYAKLGVVQHCDIEATTGNRAVKADGYKIVHKDDIVVNIILCWMGALGKSEYDGVTSPAYDVYQPKHGVNCDYYHYLFRTNMFCGECMRQGRGIMMMRWRTYSKEFTAIHVPFPPPDEQQTIVDFIDRKVREIDGYIGKIREQIEKLKLYKQRLISDAVTGKIDVRNTRG